MSNLLQDLFTKDYSASIEKWRKQYKEERHCFGCKHCIDISDTYNTCHKCEYGGFLPDEHTCLLWEEIEE